MASGFATVATAQKVGEGVDDKGRPTETFLMRAHPVNPGIRGSLEIGFEGPTELDVDVDGQRSSRDTDFDYLELRVAFGASTTFGELWSDSDDLYLTLEPIDFVMRDVSGHSDRGRFGNDQYALYIGGELGVLLPLSRIGLYGRWDFVRGILGLLGDAPASTWDTGIVGSLGTGSLRLEARWGAYQWSDEDVASGGYRRVDGSMVTFAAIATF